jgi:hypothetical protein
VTFRLAPLTGVAGVVEANNKAVSVFRSLDSRDKEIGRFNPQEGARNWQRRFSRMLLVFAPCWDNPHRDIVFVGEPHYAGLPPVPFVNGNGVAEVMSAETLSIGSCNLRTCVTGSRLEISPAEPTDAPEQGQANGHALRVLAHFIFGQTFAYHRDAESAIVHADETVHVVCGLRRLSPVLALGQSQGTLNDMEVLFNLRYIGLDVRREQGSQSVVLCVVGDSDFKIDAGDTAVKGNFDLNWAANHPL